MAEAFATPASRPAPRRSRSAWRGLWRPLAQRPRARRAPGGGAPRRAPAGPLERRPAGSRAPPPRRTAARRAGRARRRPLERPLRLHAHAARGGHVGGRERRADRSRRRPRPAGRPRQLGIVSRGCSGPGRAPYARLSPRRGGARRRLPARRSRSRLAAAAGGRGAEAHVGPAGDERRARADAPARRRRALPRRRRRPPRRCSSSPAATPRWSGAGTAPRLLEGADGRLDPRPRPSRLLAPQAQALRLALPACAASPVSAVPLFPLAARLRAEPELAGRGARGDRRRRPAAQVVAATRAAAPARRHRRR